MLALVDGDSFLSAATWGRDFEGAKKHILFQIASTVENTYAKEYLIAVGAGDGSNFREKLYPLYKQSISRINSRLKRPAWFKDLKEYLLDQAEVVPAIGCEADDLVRMWSVEARNAGDPFVVSSIDKDLDCISGHHYNPRNQELYVVTEDSANEFYWRQILMGDSVDNIPGLPGIGPVKAKSMLAGLKTDEARRDRVMSAYMDVYGEEWESYLNTNGRLIHMWRFEHDYFCIGN